MLLDNNNFIRLNILNYKKIENLIKIGDIYLIKNFQNNIKNKYYLINYDFNYLYFLDSNNNSLNIEFYNLQNYKIINNKNENVSIEIFNSIFYELIIYTVNLIYEYQLKNIHILNLNNIFNNFISRYKIIFNYLKKILYKADFTLTIDKNKNYILK